MAQRWYRKATVQAALAAGILAFAALIFSPLITRTLEKLPDWITQRHTPEPCQRLAAGKVQYYEAETAELFGDASNDTEHAGYSGKGYVSGYGGRPGTATTFWVDVPSASDYQVTVCYANGTRGVKTLTIYVNNELVKQTRLSNASRWNIWMTRTEPLPLKMGLNTISYRKDFGDNGDVNLDFIAVTPK